MLLLPPSRPSALFNSLTSARLDSRVVSTTSHRPLFRAEILSGYSVMFVWLSILLPSPRLFQESTTNSISCMPSVPLFTGMLEKVWKRDNSQTPVKILPILRKIMKREVGSETVEGEEEEFDEEY